MLPRPLALMTLHSVSAMSDRAQPTHHERVFITGKGYIECLQLTCSNTRDNKHLTRAVPLCSRQ